MDYWNSRLKYSIIVLYALVGCSQNVNVDPQPPPRQGSQIKEGEKVKGASGVEENSPVTAKKQTFIKFTENPMPADEIPDAKKCKIEAGTRWNIDPITNPIDITSGHVKVKLSQLNNDGGNTACENRSGWIYMADWEGGFIRENGCCSFPLAKPTNKVCESAGGGAGAFGAPRGNRDHAACDIYALEGTPIYAVDDGVVIQDSYEFYCATDALEIKHPGRVVRYGEIKPYSAVKLGMRAGTKVKKGQQVGTVGWLSCYDQPMLHFETFAGTAKGQLTDMSDSKYSRRKDLVNPTAFVKKLINLPPKL